MKAKMLAWVEDPATLVLKTAKSSVQSAGLLVKVAGKLSSPTVPLAPISSLQSLCGESDVLGVFELSWAVGKLGDIRDDCTGGSINACIKPRGSTPPGYRALVAGTTGAAEVPALVVELALTADPA
ncbi:MAG: hypothetical protein WAM85_07110 [Terracidiphilus sp.]